MIFVLHGEDLNGAYTRLKDLLAKFPKHQKVRLSDKNSKEDLTSALFTNDIFGNDKVIVCENFIHSQKIKEGDIKKIPKIITTIFWEQKKLAPAIISKIKSYAQIEIFKEKPQIFWFLDSISPSLERTLNSLSKLNDPDGSNITFHLANRMLLLILAKMQISQGAAEQINGRPIAPWQWQRFQSQAKSFSASTLKKIYSGTLKIDSMIKSGQTSLNQSTLISTLLAKYLPG